MIKHLIQRIRMFFILTFFYEYHCTGIEGISVLSLDDPLQKRLDELEQEASRELP
jgi:hypothetical protein